MGQGASKPVDFEQLKALMPEISGWTRGKTSGQQMNMPVSFSQAEASYEKGDSSLKIEITDSALSQLLLMPLSMFMASGFEQKSDEGYTRASPIGGSPGFEEWTNDGKQGEVTAVVGGRFIVKATGRGVDGIEAVRKAVEAVNLSKLASLK